MVNNQVQIDWLSTSIANTATITLTLPKAYMKYYIVIAGKGDNNRGSFNQAWCSTQNQTLTTFQSTAFDTNFVMYISIGY